MKHASQPILVNMRFEKVSVALSLLCLLSCSSGTKKADKDLTAESAVPSGAVTSAPITDAPPGSQPNSPAPSAPKKVAELEDLVQKLNAKIETLESRIASLGERVDTTRGSVQNLVMNQRARPTSATAHPADAGGVRVKTPSPSTDPESGFVNDEAVQQFRRAMVLHRAGKYSDSLMRFSGFLEQFPDHPLAGNAQFFLGNAYFMQKEYKLALQEYQRVLTSYDRSGLVARTLMEMAESEDHLKRDADAAHHRQLLNSLFPHSPFAGPKQAKRMTPENPPAAASGDLETEASKNTDSSIPSTAPPTAPIKQLDPVPGVAGEPAH